MDRDFGRATHIVGQTIAAFQVEEKSRANKCPFTRSLGHHEISLPNLAEA